MPSQPEQHEAARTWAAWATSPSADDAQGALRVLDLLRALGLRLTPDVRAVACNAGGDVAAILRAANAAAGVRAERTVVARRALDHLPGELQRRVAALASAGVPWSEGLGRMDRAPSAAADARARSAASSTRRGAGRTQPVII